MPFLSVLEIGLLIFCLAEALADRYPNMQKQIFHLAFAWAFVWSTLKFAYGPDIITYIPLYRTIAAPGVILSNWGSNLFESGFMLFTSVCKSLHMHYWTYTAVISVLYFSAVFLLMRKVNYYPTIAFTILMCLDSNLYLKEFRQCLAVTFFIFGILLFMKKYNLWAALSLMVSCTMHHSAKYIILVTIILYGLSFIKPDKRAYYVLFFTIIALLFIPLGKLASNVEFVSGNKTLMSLAEHISVSNNGFQKVVVVYIALTALLAYYMRPNEGNKTMHWIMWCCIALIVLIFDYWFLLNRLRSYFLPFLILYTTEQLSGYSAESSSLHDKLPKQLFAVLLFAFVAFDAIWTVPQNLKKQKYPTDTICLVTQLRHTDELVLTERQMQRAVKYWKNDYNTSDNDE